MDIKINVEDMEDAINILTSSQDDVANCLIIINSYQEALDEMSSKYINKIDGIDTMVNEAMQLVEAITNAIDSIGSVKEEMLAQDNEGKKIKE